MDELENADEATVNAAYEAAQDAYDALEALNPEEQEQITGVEKLMTLMKWFNEKTSIVTEYNRSNVHGIENEKTYCGDTYFTVDIPAEHLVEVFYYHKASGTYPLLKPEKDGRYKLDAGLGVIHVTVHWNNRVYSGGTIDIVNITINADHADIDKDHNCENGCGKTVGTHEDADKDHICDYGCKEAIGICADADKDHKCDYGCGKNFGTHVDADLNHICDYGCDEAIGICADADKDHKCDYGCGKTFGVCSGGTATCKDKAVCDYCGKPYGELDSSNHAGGTEVRNAKDATCTEDGYTGDTYCKGCETKLSSGKSVDKTGHDFGEDGKCKCGAVKFTVTFDANGGSVDTATAITDLDGKLSALPTPTREGYVFDGWYTEKEGGTKVETDTVYTAHTTLYAHWRKIVTRLDFSLSGYGYKKPFIDTTVTPGAGNEGATYGDNYAGYGDYYGIVTDQNSLEALSSGVFREEKDYFLYVTFFEAEGFTLSDLKGKNIFLNGVPALAVVRKDGQMTAVFDLRTIYLIKATAGKNGEIDPEGTVAVFEGDDITFTITPDDGYLRSTVKVDGKKVKNAKTYTFEDVQESHTIQATFVKSTNPKTGDDSGMQWVFHTLTISAGTLAALLLLRKKKRTA